MPRGNDFCNNELWNPVVHPVDPTNVDVDGRLVERGIPAVGKVVTQNGVLWICSAVEPDPTFDGGGTWQEVGSGIVGFTDSDYTNFSLYQDDTLTTPITATGGGSNGALYCQIVENLLGTSGYLLTQMFWTYTFTATVISGATAGDSLWTRFPSNAGGGLYTLAPANGSDIGGPTRLIDVSAGIEYQGVSQAFSSGGFWWLRSTFPTSDDPMAGGFQFAANDEIKMMFSGRVDLTPVGA